MKRSLIWTAVGAAVIGIGVPAYAAVQTSKPQPSITTVTTVEDVRGNCDEAEHANDPGCAGAGAATDDTTAGTSASTTPTTEDSRRGNDDATESSVDDNDDDATGNSVDDDDATETSNSVEDVSGPCDEAEHANDPRCAAGAAPDTTVDDSSHSGGADDGTRHDAGDDSNSGKSGNSGHGGSDDSGHGGGED